MINHFYNKNKDKVTSEKFFSNYDKILDRVTRYSYYNERTVWSPAKITQICLTYMDDSNYLENILDYLKDNYQNEIKLLNITNIV